MYKKLNTLIKKYETIIIHRHSNPDGDALGSQFGLAELIDLNFDNKKIYTVGSEDEIKTNSIRHVFKKKFDNPKDKDYKEALVIVVDTANIERIEGQDFFKGDFVIKIDHHASTEEYGDLEIIENKISSTCEILTNMASELKWKFNKEASEYLLTGIITDTGRFMFNSVDENTFKAAHTLASNGAKISKLVNKLNDRDLAFTRLQAKIQSDFSHENGVSWYMMPKGLHKKYGVPYSTASAMVFSLMAFNEANYGAFISYDENTKVWKGSLRSKKKPINKLAEEFNGGGHEMASGFKLKDKKQFNQLVKELKKLNKK